MNLRKLKMGAFDCTDCKRCQGWHKSHLVPVRGAGIILTTSSHSRRIKLRVNDSFIFHISHFPSITQSCSPKPRSKFRAHEKWKTLKKFVRVFFGYSYFVWSWIWLQNAGMDVVSWKTASTGCDCPGSGGCYRSCWKTTNTLFINISQLASGCNVLARGKNMVECRP